MLVADYIVLIDISFKKYIVLTYNEKISFANIKFKPYVKIVH